MAVNYDSQEDALHMRVFRNRPEPGHKRVHVHPTHELNFLCHGYQGLEVENRNYTMCPGDLLVLPAGMEHSIRSDESLPYQRIRLHIPVNFIRTLAREDRSVACLLNRLFSGKEWVIRFSAIEAAQMQNLMEHMVGEEEHKKPGWEYAMQARAGIVALMAARSLDQAIAPMDPNLMRHRHDMNLVIHFMEEHYSEPITLTGMAQIFDVHPSVLSRNFKRVTGVAPMLYLNRIRIAQAKLRMESTQEKLEDIAQAVGYNSLIYFSRVFKQLNGMAPSAYRKSVRGLKKEQTLAPEETVEE